MREHPSFRTTFLEFVAFPYPHKWPPDQGRLKGNQAEDTSWPVNVQNVQICPSMGFICFFCQHFCKRSCFFNANLSSPGHSHAGLLFTNEEQKKVGSRHIFNTFATHAQFIYCFCTWAVFSSMFYWPVDVFLSNVLNVLCKWQTRRQISLHMDNKVVLYLFMMSAMQTAGHKMAAQWLCFCDFSCQIQQTGPEIGSKTATQVYFNPFL